MNICFYTDFSLSGMTGGIGRATTVLTNYFRQHYGWKVFSIYAFEAKQDCILTPTDGSVRLRLHDRLGVRRLQANYKAAVRFIIERQIDIVIIQTSLDVVAKLQKALRKADAGNVKVISVLHYSPGTDEFPITTTDFWGNLVHGNIPLKDIAKGVIAPLYNRWEHIATVCAYRKAYYQGDKVVLLSQSYIPEYQKFAGLKENLHLCAIPNCVPFEYTITQKELCKKQKTALVVGRMVDFPKRISSILYMWKEIEAQNPEWNLEIVGDGPDLEAFKKLSLDLKLNNCTFFGRQDPLEYYLRASLFLMTSEFEGFPMTLVEAQQMGCVPVAFDSFGSLKEVIADNTNGRIVSNNATKEFIDVILALMSNDDDRQRLMTNAIHSCKEYRQSAICAQWKQLIETLVRQ